MKTGTSQRQGPGLIVSIFLGVLIPLGLFWLMRDDPPEPVALGLEIERTLNAGLPFTVRVASVDAASWKRLESGYFEGNVNIRMEFAEPVYALVAEAGDIPLMADIAKGRRFLETAADLAGRLPENTRAALAAQKPKEPFAETVLVYPRHAAGEQMEFSVEISGHRRAQGLEIRMPDPEWIQALHPSLIAARRYAQYAQNGPATDVASPRFAEAAKNFAEASEAYETLARRERDTYSQERLKHTLRPGAAYFSGHYGLLVEASDLEQGTLVAREIFLRSKKQRMVVGKILPGDHADRKPVLELTLPTGEKAGRIQVGDSILEIQIDNGTVGFAFAATPEELRENLKSAGLSLSFPKKQ
ncbi:MAG: hypothetical protein LIP28_03165 [Deltaproteobacteria bacterium]|nr:hypothetical protein [Deltaproteobacteria bacterium]